ncbi:MAG: hypothetical protein RIE73_26835 [Coleofasciculus sp. C1-SOL-03]|jgi:hypothetical protein|uniref:hypothetical protein n=1 Tax=Coleofasciculus sp. C1-SOL-03 TaxID=3069522 RepID=UPI003302624F
MTSSFYHKLNRLILTGTTTTILATTSLTSFVLAASRPAQANPEVDLYTLCTKFPLNSRCEGYEPPVSLKQRSGHEGICALISGETDLSGKCKISLTEGVITAYIEQGDRLAVLDDERPTQEITVAASDVATLTYQEGKKANVGRIIGNTLLFGVLGAIFTKPDQIAQIEVGFTGESDPATTQVLTLVTERELGLTLRTNLERLTGIFAEIPAEAEPEAQEATVDDSETYSTDLDEFCESYPHNSRCQNPTDE